MTKQVFDKIAEGLHEAIDVARGAARPTRLHVSPDAKITRVLRLTRKAAVRPKNPRVKRLLQDAA